MTCGQSPHHGFAMTWSRSDHHPGRARMTSERSSDHGFAMTCGRSPHQKLLDFLKFFHTTPQLLMWAPPTRHPGEARTSSGSAWMMVASRPRHGEAMMRALPACHPGSARTSWLCHDQKRFLIGKANAGEASSKVIFDKTKKSELE
jgi:hypothetical protein